MKYGFLGRFVRVCKCLPGRNGLIEKFCVKRSWSKGLENDLLITAVSKLWRTNVVLVLTKKGLKHKLLI